MYQREEDISVEMGTTSRGGKPAPWQLPLWQVTAEAVAAGAWQCSPWLQHAVNPDPGFTSRQQAPCRGPAGGVLGWMQRSRQQLQSCLKCAILWIHLIGRGEGTRPTNPEDTRSYQEVTEGCRALTVAQGDAGLSPWQRGTRRCHCGREMWVRGSRSFGSQSPLVISRAPWWLRQERICHSAGDPGSVTGSERSPGEGTSYPLQYSCLENSKDRGAWWVCGVTNDMTEQRYKISNFRLYEETHT